MRVQAARLGASALVAVLAVSCGSADTDALEATDEQSEDVADDPPSTEPSDAEPDTTADDDPEPEQEPPESDDDVATGPDDPQPTDAPLAFSARSLDGGTIDVAAFADGPVAMWMWTPW